MIAGLETTSAGDILFAGQPVNHLTPEQRNVAMVFQFYALYPALTVAENLAFPLFAEHLPAPERDARVNKVAEILHLTEILDRKPSEIAEGENSASPWPGRSSGTRIAFCSTSRFSRLDVELREPCVARSRRCCRDYPSRR